MPRGKRAGLDRLLELRRRLEESRTAELARARSAVSEAEEAVRSLEDRRRAAERSLGSGDPCSVGRVQSVRFMIDRIDAGLRNARTVRQAAETEADARAAAFIDATRDREAVERVLQGRQAHARQLRLATEQKLQDEVAIHQFLNNVRKDP